MFISYIKIGLRNLIRHKGYTFINLTGLAVGMACAALILIYLREELSYDRYHSKAERIYRLTLTISRNGVDDRIAGAAAPMGPAIAEEFPEVLKAARVADPWASILVQYQEKQFEEPKVYYADQTLFEILDLPFQQGDQTMALRDPQSVVLSEEVARKYFGDENPIGKIISIERGNSAYQVTGVLKQIPTAVSFRPDFIIPFNNLGPQRLTNWLFFSYPTYLLLRESSSPKAVEGRFAEFVKKHYAEAPDDFPTVSLGLQPLTDTHLQSQSRGETGKLSPTTYMVLFSALAFLILAVACINFMNLATARAQRRAMEVGVRKVLGGFRSHLILQFLAESLLLTFAAMVEAVILIELALPTFNQLAQKQLALHFGSDWTLAAGFVLLAIVVGIAAGSYPAFILSRFHPIDVLKGTTQRGTHGSLLRQLLVVTQFTISIFLLACTLTVNSQIEYVRNKRLGFEKEQVVSVQLKSDRQQNTWSVLKNALLRHPEIMNVSGSSGTPADPHSMISPAERGDADIQQDAYTFEADYDYLNTLGIKLAAGRFLSPDYRSDSTQGFVLNETAVRKFGWASAQAAIGRPLTWNGYGPDHPKKGTIVGVIQDFHFRPLYEEIAPAIFHLTPDGKNYLLVRVKPNNMDRALEALQAEWRTFDPSHPIEFSFLDENVEAQYGAETRLLKVFSIFSGLAIAVSCFGLLGLVSFTTEQRTKEIGIRKVLGASAANIVLMLSRGLALLLMVAFVVAAPLAWYATSVWLQNFAYHRPVDLGIFVLSGIVVLCLAWITVSYQTMKAAFSNPVEALRYE
jgi:putative ABC transport system permease protein